MPTTNKKIIFYADPDIVRFLEAENARTGAPISELVRRAVKLLAFGEAQTLVFQCKAGTWPPVDEVIERRNQTQSPVLFAGQKTS